MINTSHDPSHVCGMEELLENIKLDRRRLNACDGIVDHIFLSPCESRLLDNENATQLPCAMEQSYLPVAAVALARLYETSLNK